MAKQNKKEEALAVIPVSEFAIAKMNEGNVADAIKANLGGRAPDEFDLERIGMPAGGGLFWTIDGKPVDVINCVIVGHHDANAWWEKSIDDGGGNQPPDCISRDGFTGVGIDESPRACDSCPLNQFGSAVNKDGSAGKGKACKNMKVIFALRPDSLLPLVIIAPPTSLTGFRQHMTKLAGRGIKYNECITQFTLGSKPNARGIEYSYLECAKAGDLSPEEKQLVAEYSEGMAPSMQRDIVVEHGDIGDE